MPHITKIGKGYPLDDAMVGITPDELRELYCIKGWNLRQIALYYGISKGAIDCRMNKWQIPARPNPHCPGRSHGYKAEGLYVVTIGPF